MKKLLLFVVCIAFVLCACNKKGAVIADAFISANIDGVNENFNLVDSAVYHDIPNHYVLSVSARTDATPGSHRLQLDIFSPTPITVGSYSVAPVYNPPYGPLVVYSTTAGINLADDYVIDYTDAHPFTINIASLTKTNIQGTFSGTLVVAAGTSGATKTFTNGKFNLTTTQ